jgi:hypothetical protein
MALTNNLLAFYKLDNTNDSSGNNRTLTNNGNVSFASGKIGNAAVFDGTNSLEKAPFNVGQNFSVSFWANLNEVTDYGFFVVQYGGFVIYTRADGSIEVGDCMTWNFATASGVVETGVWKHYCLSVSNGVGTLYANNSVLGNSEGNPPLDLTDDGDRQFGISGDSVSSGYINGSIDAVGVWDRALNSTEVAELYNNGTGLELEVPNLTSGLQAFYKLSDTSDSSGNNRTLTNNGNVSFASGKIGNAAIMDEASKVLSKDQFQIGNNFAISLWAKQLTNDSQAGLVGQYPGLWMSITTDGAVGLSDLASWESYSASGLISLNQWNHYALNVVDGYAKVYLNGTLVLDDNANQMTLWSDAERGFGIGGEPLNTSGTKEMDAVGIWNRALSDAEVAALYNNGTGLELEVQAPVVDLEDGLQAFYKLSDTSDSSGNNRTLTNNGNVSFASGKIGNAAVFDGSNYFSNANLNLNGAEAVTCSVWFKGPEQGGQKIIVSKWNEWGVSSQFVMTKSSLDDIRLLLLNQDGSYVEANAGSFIVDEWNHATFAYNGSEVKFFLNGNLQDTQSFSGGLLNSDAIFAIGTSQEGLGSQEWTGSIDAVGIWNRALSDAEVAALYNNGTGLEIEAPVVDLESGLQAFYKLSDTSDSSGNGNTLTNNGDVSFASGKLGNAAVFDGSNYFDIDISTLPQGSQDRTISFWFNSLKTEPQVPLYYGTPSGGELVLFYIDSGSIVVSPYGDGVYSSEILNDGNWHNILFKINNQSWILYVDGILKDTQFRQTTTNGTVLTIGTGPDGSTEGSIDAVGIWNRALSDAEVAALYNNGTGLELGTTPTLNTITKIQGNAKFYGKVKFGV